MSRRIRWVGHVARVGTGDVHRGVWWGYLRGRNHLEVLGIIGRRVIKWIFEKWDGKSWTGLM
jgi:hypothetical protein